MKKLMSALAALCAVGSLFAYTETVDGIAWTYTVSSGEAHLYNNGNAVIHMSTTGAIAIPSALDGYAVTSIGDYAFSGCSGLTSVTIPNSVTNIGDYAFWGCSGLTSATIPNGVASIGERVFRGCSGLVSVTIPGSVKSIEKRAFYGCSGLTSVTMPGSVKSIGYEAFWGCSGLASVMIPDSVTSIEERAFYGCSGLTSVRVSIGDADRVRGLLENSGFDVTNVSFIGQPYKVTFGKNGGTGGDNYVSATYGAAMPTPRTAPTQSGWTFGGYWDTLAMDETGNPKGKQYYDANMKSVRAWDKKGDATLWAKWTNRVTLGKNGGTGGDDYVTCTRGQPMPTPRTAPTRSGWTFGGYWDTLACDSNGNPLGKQYYNAKMESVRSWDKPAEATLWAKWTVRVTLGKNGGTGGDNYVTVTYNQPFPTRTMPTKSGYTFGGYWVSSSSKTGQCYEADGTGTSTMKWTTGGTPTIWALWTANP